MNNSTLSERALAKTKTKEKLLRIATSEFTRYGFLGGSTERIARKAKVAHGTVFFHFPTKNSLQLEVLYGVLREVTDRLYTELYAQAGLGAMVDILLDGFIQHEKFFSAIAKDKAKLPDKMLNEILLCEAVLKDYLARTMAEDGLLSPHENAMALTFLFSTIDHYLALGRIYKPRPGNSGKVKTSTALQDNRTTIKTMFLKMAGVN